MQGRQTLPVYFRILRLSASDVTSGFDVARIDGMSNVFKFNPRYLHLLSALLCNKLRSIRAD